MVLSGPFEYVGAANFGIFGLRGLRFLGTLVVLSGPFEYVGAANLGIFFGFLTILMSPLFVSAASFFIS